MASNYYVPEYGLSDLRWYERDGLMTWYNQRKREEFLRDSKIHFKNTKIVNLILFQNRQLDKKFLMKLEKGIRQ